MILTWSLMCLFRPWNLCILFTWMVEWQVAVYTHTYYINKYFTVQVNNND